MTKLVPFKEIEKEIEVLNSRFIATLAPASSVEEARIFVKLIKERYPDASHHVPAFVIGSGNSVISHCSDDGEPTGTAGRPALAVLQGSRIADAVVVVTRYFGGTKLGKGGLVRAYGDAVRAVLQAAPLAEIVQTSLLRVVLTYPHYELVKRSFERHHFSIEKEDFAEQVTLDVRIDNGDELKLQKIVNELTAGQAITTLLVQDEPFRKSVIHSIYNKRSA